MTHGKSNNWRKAREQVWLLFQESKNMRVGKNVIVTVRIVALQVLIVHELDIFLHYHLILEPWRIKLKLSLVYR